MSVSLQKGQKISLSKLDATLRRVVVACGWDANQGAGEAYDLDLTAAALDASGKVPSQDDPTDRDYQEWFVHANHRRPSGGSIQFMGDNRTGRGDGDDEKIKVDLTKVSDEIVRIVFAVVIWRAGERKQWFGKVKNAFIRLYDEETGKELARFDIPEEFSEETLVKFGELYRHNGEWKFEATGQGYDTAAKYRADYGIKPKFEYDYARYNN